MLQDHGHGASALCGVSVNTPAFASINSYSLMSDDRHMVVNNLPTVVMKPHLNQESNSQPPDHKSNAQLTALPWHLITTRYLAEQI